MGTEFVRSPINGIHHAAYRCVDAEQTRWFYEDVLGLKFAAGLTFEEAPGSNEEIEYMHLFFETGDGHFIAFFDAPDNAPDDALSRKHSFDVHVAFEVADEAELLAMQKRILEKGKTCLGPVDHDFVRSMYMYDPNGIRVEITCRTDKHDAILMEEGEKADEIMKDWTSRTKAKKIAKFGEALTESKGFRAN